MIIGVPFIHLLTYKEKQGLLQMIIGVPLIHLLTYKEKQALLP